MEHRADHDAKDLGIFEKYLTVWVFACIVAGLLLGLIPGMSDFFRELELFGVSIPIAACLFLMIYSIMVQIDFKSIIQAAKTARSVGISSAVNWLIKPFTKMLLAILFFRFVFAPFIPVADADAYIAGLVLLGLAPCTAMVLMWVYLARGNQGLNVVMIAIDSLIMIAIYAPMATWLLGVAEIVVPMDVIAFSIAIYVGLPLLAGYLTRKRLIDTKGIPWFETRFSPSMGKLAKGALLVTLVILFTYEGGVILNQPLVIVMIAVPLTLQFFVIFGIAYVIARLGKLSYKDMATVTLVGTSNHFEVAIAVATMLVSAGVLGPGAPLATVVGVLIEVPIMLVLVKLCQRAKKHFPDTAVDGAAGQA